MTHREHHAIRCRIHVSLRDHAPNVLGVPSSSTGYGASFWVDNAKRFLRSVR